MTIRFTMALVTLFVAVSVSAQTRQAESPLVVSTAWLADHLQDPDLVVLQTSQAEAARDQIPGASRSRAVRACSRAATNADALAKS